MLSAPLDTWDGNNIIHKHFVPTHDNQNHQMFHKIRFVQNVGMYYYVLWDIIAWCFIRMDDLISPII